MGTIAELGLRVVRNNREITIFLPDYFPFSAGSLSNTLRAIKALLGNMDGGLAQFTEQDGMEITFYLRKGAEAEGLKTFYTAALPLCIEQPEEDKPQLKLLARDNEMVLIEPSQVITGAQIRDMIRTRPVEIQEVANGYWKVCLEGGYLKMYTENSSGFSRLTPEAFRHALTPNYPHSTRLIDGRVETVDGVRTGILGLYIQLDSTVALRQDILDAAIMPGFTNVTSDDGYIAATYQGPAVHIIDPVSQTEALREIILDFMLRLGIFPSDTEFHVGIHAQTDNEPIVTISRDFGVVSGRYSNRF